MERERDSPRVLKPTAAAAAAKPTVFCSGGGIRTVRYGKGKEREGYFTDIQRKGGGEQIGFLIYV